MDAEQRLAAVTRERDDLVSILAVFVDVVTPEQFGRVRARLADQDLGIAP